MPYFIYFISLYGGGGWVGVVSFNSKTGQVSVDDCGLCPPGTYGSDLGLTSDKCSGEEEEEEEEEEERKEGGKEGKGRGGWMVGGRW